MVKATTIKLPLETMKSPGYDAGAFCLGGAQKYWVGVGLPSVRSVP